MPIYEYTCKKCGREFELIQKFSDPPAKCCPSCGGKAEKKLSLSSFQLKGTGWYITDYARKDKEKKEGKKVEEKKTEEKKTPAENKTSKASSADSSKKESSKPQ